MELLILYIFLTISLSFLCSILEAVLLSINTTFIKIEIKEGKKKRSERKYFPGYVMIKMDMNDETWHLVKDAPQVLGFIGGTSDKPVPLKQSEADNLIQSMKDDVDKPKPKVMFEPGEVVRIIDGPFNDFNGVVETVDFEKNKLKVSVLVFGKPTQIELSLTQVEKG